MEKDFWVLREGDLFPESTKNYKFMNKRYLDELKEAGLLFESKDEAMQVTNILRNSIKSLRSGQCECTHKPFAGHVVDFRQGHECASHQCQCNNPHSHKREHILRIVHGHDSERSEGTFPKIEITVLL